jgi:hypothetical protein
MITRLILLPILAAGFLLTSGLGTEVLGGPPPWAPAHGYRAKHTYSYYPARQVYYDTKRNLYFYYHNGQWQMSGSLPFKLRISLGSNVTLEMGTDRPYEHHSEVKKNYPPDRGRGKDKSKR